MGKKIRTNQERQQMLEDQAAAVRAALGEADDTATMRDGPATSGGDARRLRGIPAIGRNVSGCIPGTDPEREATKPRRVAYTDGEALYDAITSRARIRRARSQNAADRSRARAAGAHTENVSRRDIIERDNSTCYICGRSCQPNEIHLDHIVPLSRGGSHTADNLGVTCAPCNTTKGAQHTSLRPPALLPSTQAESYSAP